MTTVNPRISAHIAPISTFILAKVEGKEIVEYRYRYFKDCKWVSEGREKPNKSFNTDASDAGTG